MQVAAKRSVAKYDENESSMDSQPSKKRKREYTEADATLAETLEKLGSEIDEDRIKAAVDVVTLYTGSDYLSEKILFRLIRGLCSSRKAARPGFFVALTEILKVSKDEPQLLGKQNFAEVLSLVLDKVASETKVEGGARTQEKRDYVLGRLAAYSAIVHSDVLFDDKLKKTFLGLVLQQIHDVSLQTPQLMEQCGKVYMDLIVLAVSRGRKETIQDTLRFLADKNLLKTPEGIAVWLEASNSSLEVRFPKHVWHHKNPLARKEWPAVAKILKGGDTRGNSKESTKSEYELTGSRRDAPHFAWNNVLDHFYSEMDRTKDKMDLPSTSLFKEFWTEFVDDIYFASAASIERKALGLRIFSLVVSSGPTAACVAALTPKLVSCLINQHSKDERFLHNAATSILGGLKLRASLEPILAVGLLQTMLLQDGKVDIDRLKKSKPFLGDLLATANDEVVLCLAQTLTGLLFEPGTEVEQDVETARRIIADHLVSALRLRKRQSAEDIDDPHGWRAYIVQMLTESACVEHKSESSSERGQIVASPPFITSSHEMLKSKLLSCLKELLSSGNGRHVDIVVAVAQDLLNHDEKQLVHFSRVRDAGSIIALGQKFLDELGKPKHSDRRRIQAFQLLVSIAILQIGCGEAEAVQVLNELKESYDAINESGDYDKGGTNNVIEVILGFCSKTSALYRSLTEQTFVAFASEITANDLESMLHVLEQDENLGGQRELFDQHNSDDEDRPNAVADEDEKLPSEAESVDSDVEVVDAAADSEFASSESDGSDDIESDDEANEADEALNNSLAQILQTRRLWVPQMANGHTEEEDESSSDESMDDEQMEALGIDDQLSTIFAQRNKQAKPGKKGSDKKREQKDAKQNVLNFKNRVLDLLAIYVKQQHASAVALGLVTPLVQLIGRTRSAQVAKKASELLDSYFKTAKGKGMPLSAPAEDVLAMLSQVHTEVLVFPSKLHASACSRCSLFLGRLLMLQGDESVMETLVDLYATTHKQRFEAKSKAPASFWTDFVNWSVSMAADK